MSGLWSKYSQFLSSSFIHSTSSIRAGSAIIYCWGFSCLFGQTWDCNNYCYCATAIFYLDTWASISLLPLNLSSFLLLLLQCLFKFTALSYYCSMLLEGHSASISFLLIILFISFLNSSTSSFPSYPLSLATLLNFYTNSSIILFPYSTFFNSTIFIISLSPPPNSFQVY